METTMLFTALREFTTGLLNQLLVNLAGHDGKIWLEEFKKFLRREVCWPDENLKKLLAEREELKSRISELTRSPKLPSSNAFFQTREGLWVSDSFRNLVVAKTLPSTENWSVATKSKILDRNMTDEKIEEMLGDEHIFDEGVLCDTLAGMIQKQWGGKSGKLLNSGHPNIFYLGSCVVFVRWYADRAEWRVRAWGRGGLEWRAGDQVFSPATVA